jgi:hypothetical protein
MINVDPEAYYNIQDQNGLFYTAVHGTKSSKLDPVHTSEQARNCRQSWVKLEKTSEGISIIWNNTSLSEKLRTITDKLVFSYEESTDGFVTLKNADDISNKLKFVEIPIDVSTSIIAGFQDSKKFPTEVKMTIDESKGISILSNLLYPGISVPVKIKDRNGVSVLNFGGKFLTLEFPIETQFENMKEISKTISHNPSGRDTVQYTLLDEMQEQGVYKSSLFRVLEIEENKLYRIENFHFPGTFLNVSDDSVFYPSILTGSSSNIEISGERVETKVSSDEETTIQTESEIAEQQTKKLYSDLGLDPGTVLKAIKSEAPQEAKIIKKEPSSEAGNKTKMWLIIALIIMLLLIFIV